MPTVKAHRVFTALGQELLHNHLRVTSQLLCIVKPITSEAEATQHGCDVAYGQMVELR